MTARKVLILTYHFPPSAAVAVYRLLGLVRYLPKYGWEPVVVAPPYLPGEPIDEELTARVPPGTGVYRVPFPTSGLLRRCSAFAPHALWFLRARAAARKAIREHRPAAVLTTSPPHRVHLLGLQLGRRFGLPWVADFRDPLLSGKDLGAVSPLQRRLGRRWERIVLKKAAAVVANTPGARASLGAAHPEYAEKIVAIPNGFDPENFPTAPPHAAGGPLTILHAGELYFGRDPRPLLDALQGLRADDPGGEPPFRLRLLGRNTDDRCNLAEEVRQRGLEGVVEPVGQVPYARALEEMQRADVLLLVTGCQSRVGIPAKLYEYLGAGRPILALAESDGDVAWVLRTTGGPHRLVAPLDTVAIREALLALRREARAGSLNVPAVPAESPFTREQMARRIASVLDGCAGQDPHARPTPSEALGTRLPPRPDPVRHDCAL
jgi:glycosyltransferase involved in cell wall biosynthesis